MAKKVDYLIALINEFGKRYSLSDKDAYLFLKRNGAIAIYEDCYDYLHTQSFETAAEEIAASAGAMEGRCHDTIAFH